MFTHLLTRRRRTAGIELSQHSSVIARCGVYLLGTAGLGESVVGVCYRHNLVGSHAIDESSSTTSRALRLSHRAGGRSCAPHVIFVSPGHLLFLPHTDTGEKPAARRRWLWW